MCITVTIVRSPHLNTESSKLCGDLSKSTSTSSKLILFTAAHVKDSKVVLEDISFSGHDVKLNMLSTCQVNTHTSSSHLTKEDRLLEVLSVKTPVA